LCRSNDILPKKATVTVAPEEKGVIYAINTSSLRAWLYEGEIILDDVLSLDPFNNLFSVIRDVPASDIQHVLYHWKNKKSNEVEKSKLEIAHEQKENEVVIKVIANDVMGKKLFNDGEEDVLKRVRSFHADFHWEMEENDYRMTETHKRKEVEKLARVHGLMGKETNETLLNALFAYAISVPNIQIYPYWLSDLDTWDYEYYDVVTSSYDVGILI
jgi:hypothetical protein